MKELEQAFLRAQKKIQSAAKDKVNPHFKAPYSSYEAVVEAVKGPLNAEGLAYRHSSRAEGDNYYVGTFIVHAETGQRSEIFEIPVSKGTMQQLGSSITYAKRYTLGGITGVGSEIDDDGNHGSFSSDKTKMAAGATLGNVFKKG